MPGGRGREVLFGTLQEEGVEVIFGNPGTTELPIYDELVVRSEFRLVMGLQEGAVVAMADGYARVTGRPSFITLHVAPGLANGLGNVYNAWRSRVPLVVTAGQQDTRHLHQEPLLSADLAALARPVTKASFEVRRPEELGPFLWRAFRLAATPTRGPCFVSIPPDILEAQVGDEAPPRRAPAPGLGPGGREELEEIARALTAAERPLLVLGGEVARVAPEAVALAEALGARVMDEVLPAVSPFPRDHPLYSGFLPPVHTGVRHALSQADVVLGVSAELVYPMYYSPVSPIPEGVRVFRVTEDPSFAAKELQGEVTVVGDAGAVIGRLVELVRQMGGPDLAGRARARMEEAARLKEESIAQARAGLGEAGGEFLPPGPACLAISEALPRGCLVFDESVSLIGRFHPWLRSGPGEYHFARGGGLGWGMGAAAGAKLADRERPVVALVGDGSACYAPQALWTAAHEGLGVVVIILNNREYQILKHGALSMAGFAAKEKVFPGMDITSPEVNFEGLARAFGAGYSRAERLEDIGTLIRQALGARGPWVVEVPIQGLQV